MTLEEKITVLLCFSFFILSSSNGQNEQKKKEIDFGLLDIRIGKILRVENIPETKNYYQLKVHFGKSSTRTIISSLAEIMKKEEFKERLTPFLLNIEPLTIHNITSHGSVLYTQGPDSEEGFTMTELLVPPLGAQPDDLVVVEGIDYKPEKCLDFETTETIFNHLTIDMNRIAKYQRKKYLNVSGKGILLSSYVKAAPIICESCPNNPGLKSEYIVKKKNIKELNELFNLT